MRTAMMLLALGLAVGPTGCKKKTATTEGAGSGSAEMVGSGSAMAGSDMGSAAMAGSAGSAMAGSDMGSAAMAGSAAMGAGAGSDNAMSHHAGNCPSTVFGSTTKAEVKGKDIVVTITSKDKNAVMAIQKRTDELLKQRAEKKDVGTAHDQKGTHGQVAGLCPVHIPDGATAKGKHEKDGVAVTITPKDKPDELKTEIDGRITKAADWVKANIQPGDKGNQGGVGGGKAEEGMNHSGSGDGKGMERKKGGDGNGGGGGTGGGGGKGTGGGGGKGSAK
jgi:hypothetical protein